MEAKKHLQLTSYYFVIDFQVTINGLNNWVGTIGVKNTTYNIDFETLALRYKSNIFNWL